MAYAGAKPWHGLGSSLEQHQRVVCNNTLQIALGGSSGAISKQLVCHTTHRRIDASGASNRQIRAFAANRFNHTG